MMTTTLMVGQLALIGVAVTKSRALHFELTSVTKKQLPATRAITLADMYHDGIRAVVMKSLYDLESNQLEALDEDVKETAEKKNEFTKLLAELEQLPLSTERKDEIKEVQSEANGYSELALTTVTAAKNSQHDQVKSYYVEFEKKFDSLEASLAKMGTSIEAEAKSAGTGGEDIVKSVILYSVYGLVLSLLVAVGIYFWTKKSFDNILIKLFGLSSKMSQLAEVLSSESAKVKDSSVEQAAAIQESVSALSEMSSMIAQTASNIKLSSETGQSTQERAAEGKLIMSRLSTSMESIQKANSSLQEIAEIISNINNKTAIINDIVFKTQLLSFNASIEAARAGQHGRGFAVVAEEVGNLAELSGTASKDIEVLLEESTRKVKETLSLIQARVSEGNRVSVNALEAFNGISKNIEDINSQLKAINEATQQQEIGIQQTNSAMKQMDISAQVNSRASNQAYHTTDNLKSQMSMMNSAVDELSHLIAGASQTNTNQESLEVSQDLTEMKSIKLHTKKNKTQDTDDLHSLASRIVSKNLPELNGEAFSSEDSISADDPDFKNVA
jgi:methyl-accepting chemotaxis protein